jgi:hypothetical protein
MNVRSFIAVALALFSAACSTTRNENPVAALEADPLCRPHRSLFQQRSSIGLHDECTRQMGEAYCQRCLIQ